MAIPSPSRFKKVVAVVNPAAGKKTGEAPDLIRAALSDAGIEAEVFLTEKAGDGKRFAKAAAEKKVDAVVVYGGDGTILEVAGGLMGSGIPLFIIPGGSANVLATEVGIPKDFKEACALMGQELYVRKIDAGQLNEGYFVVRTSLGFQAEMVKGADREVKNKLGWGAYVLSALSMLNKIKRTQYLLTIDGVERRTKGVTCIVTNAGNVGFANISMDKNIDISDGVLDVIVVRKANWSLFGHFLATILRKERPENWDLVAHWQGKEVRVVTRPHQDVECDGEILGKTAFHARILPEAIGILVPAKKETA